MRSARLLPVALIGGCVYFNAMYDANREYDAGLKALQEQSRVTARVQFDSVIAKTGRIIKDHPGSKYADDAAMLKLRAELYNELWESAMETSTWVENLSEQPERRAAGVGLGGVAARELGLNREADSLLSVGLAGDVDADDRALFLFQRGLARQDLGKSDLAAQDLEAAASSVELSDEGRLTLSIALRDIGEYGRSADLAAELLANAGPNPRSPLYLHVDSLARVAPNVVDSMVAGLLAQPDVPGTRRAGYYYIGGRAQMSAGREAEALAEFDQAVQEAPSSQIAADAAYYAIEVRLREASRPEDVTALLGSYPVARRSGDAQIRERATRWERASSNFTGLMAAYDSRGESAAEAVLRAAEVAQMGLGSQALARGAYLLYLDLVPDSRWAAKAIYGALAVAGHPPDPTWVTDRGVATDDELRRRLAELAPDDPYRLALEEGPERDAMADSMYVLAEADLRRRLGEIRMLYAGSADTTVAEEPTVDPEAEVRATDEVEF